MQMRLFTISAFDDAPGLQELNGFLRSQRVLEVQQEFVQTERGAYWCFCVRYIHGPVTSKGTGGSKRGKVDYKQVLNPKAFKIFSDLRVCRKQIAEAEAVPAFAVFTDAEMAKIAQLDELTSAALKGISCIGEKKVSKYGRRLLELYGEMTQNET